MALLETNLFDLALRLLSFPVDEYSRHPNLSAEECLFVCQLSIHRLSLTDVCLKVESPINIVGDIHGQFHDLLRIFDKLGQPPASRFIFLGDYIDRGRYSLEVIVLLLSLMLMYPDSVYLLRGNHEAGNICCRYGFKDEVRDRYGDEVGARVFHGFLRCFQWLPMAGLINEQILCCHGGLSPSFELDPYVSRDQNECVSLLNSTIQRPLEPPQFGVACDLLWADPAQYNLTIHQHRFVQDDKPTRIHWIPSKRGCSYVFSQEALESVMQTFGVVMLVRGHQLAYEGFMACLNRRCITVFSAPGYSGTHDNNGAVLQIGPKRDRLNVRKAGNFVVVPYVPNRPLQSLFF